MDNTRTSHQSKSTPTKKNLSSAFSAFEKTSSTTQSSAENALPTFNLPKPLPLPMHTIETTVRNPAKRYSSFEDREELPKKSKTENSLGTNGNDSKNRYVLFQDGAPNSDEQTGSTTSAPKEFIHPLFKKVQDPAYDQGIKTNDRSPLRPIEQEAFKKDYTLKAAVHSTSISGTKIHIPYTYTPELVNKNADIDPIKNLSLGAPTPWNFHHDNHRALFFNLTYKHNDLYQLIKKSGDYFNLIKVFQSVETALSAYGENISVMIDELKEAITSKDKTALEIRIACKKILLKYERPSCLKYLLSVSNNPPSKEPPLSPSSSERPPSPFSTLSIPEENKIPLDQRLPMEDIDGIAITVFNFKDKRDEALFNALHDEWIINTILMYYNKTEDIERLLKYLKDKPPSSLVLQSEKAKKDIQAKQLIVAISSKNDRLIQDTINGLHISPEAAEKNTTDMFVVNKAFDFTNPVHTFVYGKLCETNLLEYILRQCKNNPTLTMHTLKLFISMPPKSFSSEVVPVNEIEALKNAFDRTITEEYIGPIMNLLEKLYNSPQSKS